MNKEDSRIPCQHIIFKPGGKEEICGILSNSWKCKKHSFK